MSTAIDPKKVLCILNELGYKNIDAKLLKLFIKDLKKLRKYDQKTKHICEIKGGDSNNKKPKSVKIILTKPSGSIIKLLDDSQKIEENNE
ncbi:hypothetical protein WA026_012235 [Henosepilachna vigintioctopunctata]|uniref:Uncharacterized protein n=1 Tax=Henosepilachna vigintioctopunctata TaxID=420089 RepID=A0AAW1VBP4_9CUCU